jgi:hypothetical protein
MGNLLPVWIIGAPLVFAIFDWMRTPRAVHNDTRTSAVR